MTQLEAEEIKTIVGELNKLYHPITLSFDMYRNPKEDHDDNWFVTIVYHVTPDDWFTFVSLGFNFEMVSCNLMDISLPWKQFKHIKKSMAI